MSRGTSTTLIRIADCPRANFNSCLTTNNVLFTSACISDQRDGELMDEITAPIWILPGHRYDHWQLDLAR